MKKYMIIGEIDEGMVASYAEEYAEARDKKISIECGLGGYAEIYIRDEHEGYSRPAEYVLLEA